MIYCFKAMYCQPHTHSKEKDCMSAMREGRWNTHRSVLKTSLLEILLVNCCDIHKYTCICTKTLENRPCISWIRQKESYWTTHGPTIPAAILRFLELSYNVSCLDIAGKLLCSPLSPHKLYHFQGTGLLGYQTGLWRATIIIKYMDNTWMICDRDSIEWNSFYFISIERFKLWSS